MDFETTPKQHKEKKKRIEIIDALRGFAVILMVCHHFLYDLVEFLDAPEWLFSNPVFDVLQPFFASVFIALCGVSSNFSRSNIKRGFITLAVAIGVTGVTVMLEMPIIFGVLHLLSVCMIFYGVTHKLWEKIPKTVLLIFSILGIIISSYCVKNIEIQSEHLWIFGWQYDGFVSYDYFPLFPWLFVFLFGTWLGYYIKENRFPKWFYETKVPAMSFVGRHALVVYIIHQPVLYGITMLLGG
ncbi:MAG: DUF1624 domain-containing protein [Clostridia bacterium]|nr:DUF1624 domain-containing protein [Clostridia bacterium]